MITRICIRNFKSLADVTFYPSHFTCLIGMNGAGKSTLLQAMDFISQLMKGRIQDWLDARGWKKSDLNCKLLRKRNIFISVDIDFGNGFPITWCGDFNVNLMRMTNEMIIDKGEPIFNVIDGHYWISKDRSLKIAFDYEGSIFSVMKPEGLPRYIKELRSKIIDIGSLELLSPHLLRKKARSTEAGIGVGGEKLSAYLGTLSPEKRGRLAEALRAFYPHLTDLNVSSLRAGWKKLAVLEEFGGRRLETEAAHMNDGMLRILAVLTQLASGRSMVLLDEIENGINQELIEILVDTLVHSPHQTMVTTHSPLILNYLDDVVAKQAVQFVYKTPEGETRVRPFFSLDRMAEKLRTMGPGDAFVDTDLKRLTEECIALDREEMRGAEIEK